MEAPVAGAAAAERTRPAQETPVSTPISEGVAGVVVTKQVAAERPRLPDAPSPAPAGDLSEARSVAKAGAKAGDAGTPPDGDAPRLPASEHPWARFAPGAWRTLRTTTESFDTKGKFLGRTETTVTETLIETTADDYAIETVTLLQVGGKRLRGAPQRERRGLLSDSAAPLSDLQSLSPATLEIEGREVVCDRWRLAFGEGPQRRLETVWRRAGVSPYLLRREAVAADGTAATTTVQSVAEVIRCDVPVAVDGGIFPGCHVAVNTLTGTHRMQRLEVRTDAVPGGLVSATSTERDESGRRARWSTIELVEFGQAGETPAAEKRRWRLFRRHGD
ncbi:MAG: hypothetical protein AAGB00_11880 [Planctomycetota bacterium]